MIANAHPRPLVGRGRGRGAFRHAAARSLASRPSARPAGIARYPPPPTPYPRPTRGRGVFIMTETIHVNLGERSYDIHVGEGLLARAGELIAPFAPTKRVFVVTDENVARYHAATLRAGIAAGGLELVKLIELTPGEETKSFDGLQDILSTLLQRGYQPPRSRHRLRRRRDRRSRGPRRGPRQARRGFRANPHDVAGASRFQRRRQDRDRYARGQEPRRPHQSAALGARRYRRARDACRRASCAPATPRSSRSASSPTRQFFAWCEANAANISRHTWQPSSNRRP